MPHAHPTSTDAPALASAIETDDLAEHVRRILAATTARVVPAEWKGRRVWIKRADGGKHHAVHRWQARLAALMPFGVLKATVDSNGKRALQREAQILRRLQQKGVRVPAVLGEQADWLVLSDVGPSLHDQLKSAPDASTAISLARAGAQGLARLHASGAWHGCPQVRNIAGNPWQPAFFDFEEDPAACMGPRSLHLRDVLLFLSSLVPFDEKHPGVLAAAVVEFNDMGTTSLRLLCLWLHYVAAPLLMPLWYVRRWFGRDVRWACSVWAALDGFTLPLSRRHRLVVSGVLLCMAIMLSIEAD